MEEYTFDGNEITVWVHPNPKDPLYTSFRIYDILEYCDKFDLYPCSSTG